jgi:GT2 family glycosyltransferase
MRIDVLILNRNLRQVTDKLAESLESMLPIGQVHVIDSGSKEEEVSARTLVRDATPTTIAQGLRPNRGFNLGIDSWSRLENKAEWILLLPNDAEVLTGDFDALLSRIEKHSDIVAAVPISPDNPYINLLDNNGLGIGWNFHEGPILLRSSFVMSRIEAGGLIFDPANFRGYCAFLELAFQIYSQDKALVATNLVSFAENTGHLLSKYELIGTEPMKENQRLLIAEGEQWLQLKYGYTDRRNLEMACRLLFEEFLSVHPNLDIKPAL